MRAVMQGQAANRNSYLITSSDRARRLRRQRITETKPNQFIRIRNAGPRNTSVIGIFGFLMVMGSIEELEPMWNEQRASTEPLAFHTTPFPSRQLRKCTYSRSCVTAQELFK